MTPPPAPKNNKQKGKKTLTITEKPPQQKGKKQP